MKKYIISFKTDPTRVVEFLRGQKVPLHLRNRVPIVLLKHLDSSKENLSDITLDSPLITNTFQIANEVLEEVRSDILILFCKLCF